MASSKRPKSKEIRYHRKNCILDLCCRWYLLNKIPGDDRKKTIYQKQKSAANRSRVQLTLGFPVPKPSNYFCPDCVLVTHQATTRENVMPERDLT